MHKTCHIVLVLLLRANHVFLHHLYKVVSFFLTFQTHGNNFKKLDSALAFRLLGVQERCEELGRNNNREVDRHLHTPLQSCKQKNTHTGSNPCWVAASGSSGLHFAISALPEWAGHQWGKTEKKGTQRVKPETERHEGRVRNGRKRGRRKAIWSHLLLEVWASTTSILHSPPPPCVHRVVAVYSTPAEGPLTPPCLSPILDLSRYFVLLNE